MEFLSASLVQLESDYPVLLADFLGNSVGQYFLAFLLFVIAYGILKLFKRHVIKRLRKFAESTAWDLDNLVVKIIDSFGSSFYTILSLFLATQVLNLSPFAEKIISSLVLIVVAFFLTKGAVMVVDYSFDHVLRKKLEEDGSFDSSAVSLLSRVLKGVLWAVVIIVIIQNLGYNITALAAGLGIGGLAIAFALQNVLGDIFASFSIYFDRPFRTGDFIIVGADMGVVKQIGIKSTRLESLQGEEVVISNKELTESRVHNYKQMTRRRIVFSFGVTYSTPKEKLANIPGIVRDIFESIEQADFDRAHFKNFGDFSLAYEVVYYMNTSDYVAYMDVQQACNLKLKEQFEKEGIVFAFPTQTIMLHKEK